VKKISFIIALSCIFSSFSQTEDEQKQFNKIINKADTLFKYREYKKALNLYERAYRLCECKYPYEQIRYIKDGNLIIRNRKRN
jgi:hypothetical protein|tara:strand:+ start:125 stop:373 length:249 start_codon:yes stop_codon:yes gene_type:complete